MQEENVSEHKNAIKPYRPLTPSTTSVDLQDPSWKFDAPYTSQLIGKVFKNIAHVIDRPL